MSRRSLQPGTLRFVVIAIIFMLLMDQFVFGGKRSYIEEAKTVSAEQQAQAPVAPPVRVEPPEGKEFFEAPLPEEAKPPESIPAKAGIQQEPEQVDPRLRGDAGEGSGDSKVEDGEAEQKKIVTAPVIHPHPKIAIIIDDLGMDVKHSRQVLDLPAPVTLAFLPYAKQTKELAKIGKSKGHEMIIHVPMEAVDGKLNIGPGGLKSGMKPNDFEAAFKIMLVSFDGYVGINNHMGSRLTQDKEAMDHLMQMLADQKLFFVDSKTIQSSVAANEAADAGVPYAERDVFLDHVETSAAVVAALANAERVARRKGSAIAIGHPKAVTIEALKAWVPTLEEKGIELVPVSRLLRKPKVSAAAEEAPPLIPPPAVEDQKAAEVHEELVPSVDLFPEELPSPVIPENSGGIYPGSYDTDPKIPDSKSR